MKYFLLFICYFALKSSANVAPFIDPCHWSDGKCILKSSNKAKEPFITGNKELGIPPVSPIVLNDITADNEELKLKFKSIHVVGLEKFELISVSRDTQKSLSIVLDTPVTVTGTYVLSGKLGPLPVQGDGDFEIKTDKVRISVNAVLGDFSKNGVDHYKLSKFDYTYDPIERFYMKFDNLYNGDKKKAEPLLEILNISWKYLVSQFGKPVIDALITKKFSEVNDFIKKLPKTEFEIVN